MLLSLDQPQPPPCAWLIHCWEHGIERHLCHITSPLSPCHFVALCAAPGHRLGPGYAARNRMSSNSLNSFSGQPYLLSSPGPWPAGLFMFPSRAHITRGERGTTKKKEKKKIAPASLSDIIKLESSCCCIREHPAARPPMQFHLCHCLSVDNVPKRDGENLPFYCLHENRLQILPQ